MQTCHRPPGQAGLCLGRAISAVTGLRLGCGRDGTRHPLVACRATDVFKAETKRYAVIGAGLAGLATAYYLQKLAPAEWSVHVDVYDAVGIGAGGSGAAAGLLHPFTPKGKLLWKAHEAMSAALELLEAAETADRNSKTTAAAGAAATETQGSSSTLSWHTGMIRPASSVKQSQHFWKMHSSSSSLQPQQQHQNNDHAASDATLQQLLTAFVVSSAAAQQLLPGLRSPATSNAPATDMDLKPSEAQQQQPQQQQVAPQLRTQQRQQLLSSQGLDHAAAAAAAAALHIPGGITLHAQRYMQALWAAAEVAAANRANGSSVSLHIQQLKSLEGLSESSGAANSSCYDAVIVAAGAAIGSLQEFSHEALPLSLCQGYTLDMVPPEDQWHKTNNRQHPASALARDESVLGASGPSKVAAGPAAAAAGAAAAYGASSPSILGSPYLASQGGQVLVVGATKSHGWTAQQAYEELGRKVDLASLHQQQLLREAVHDGPHLIGSVVLQQQHHQQQQQTSQEAAEVSAAAAELLTGAAAVWPAVLEWRVGGIRTGVRAIPPRTQQGSVPLLGQWHGKQQQQQLEQQTGSARPPVWLIVGLGARGLVYHAWLAQLTAEAVLSGSEGCIQRQGPELLAWRTAAGSSPVGTDSRAAAMT